jgi:hypothetical protein
VPTSEQKVQAYHFGPLQRPDALAGLSWFQVASVGSCGAVAIGLVRTLPSSSLAMALGVGLVAIGFAVGFVRIGGRLVEEWAHPVRYWLGGKGRRARHWVRPQAPEARALAAPPGLEHLRFFGVRLSSGEVGVVFDQANGTYLGVVSCRGGAFALVDRTEQDRLLRAWGDVLNGWCVDDESIHRLQLLERTLPEDGDALVDYLERAVAVPEGTPALVGYRSLLAGAEALSQRHESFAVIAVSQSAAAIRRAGGGERAACEALAQELVSLRDRARMAEIDVEGVLGPEEVVRCFRIAFDPQAALRPEGWPPQGDGAPRLVDAWPDETRTTWSHFEADGVVHASFWVAEWPRTPVGADFLGPLILHSRSSRTLSIVMEPVPPERAAEEVQAERTSFLASKHLREKRGELHTAFHQVQGEALDRREADLAAGHGEFRYSGYVSVSATAVDQLETAVTAVVRLANRCRLRLWRLYGQQNLGFETALPLARGLR